MAWHMADWGPRWEYRDRGGRHNQSILFPALCTSTETVCPIRKYDPYYAEKVKLVVERIDDELSKRAQFSIAGVNRYLDFDSDRHLRLLGRNGFLAAFSGQDGRIAGFSQAAARA
jgi:hypothetical protein